MSKRNEHSRRHGHWDPRWYAPKAAAHQDSEMNLITGHDSTRREERYVAFRHELCDTHGNYVGTFVTEIECWQIGDAFTGGNGQSLRIIGIAPPQQSSERPAFTDRWDVEANEGGGSNSLYRPPDDGDVRRYGSP